MEMNERDLADVGIESYEERYIYIFFEILICIFADRICSSR